jgi:hypothetical protein
MADGSLVVVEFLVVFGLPVAWGVWELISLRRDRMRDEEREDRRAEVQPGRDDPEPG